MSRLNRLMERIHRPYKGKPYICRLKTRLGAAYHPCDSVNNFLLLGHIKCPDCPFDTPEVLEEFEEELCRALKY